jgi:hypothetical protein
LTVKGAYIRSVLIWGSRPHLTYMIAQNVNKKIESDSSEANQSLRGVFYFHFTIFGVYVIVQRTQSKNVFNTVTIRYS